MAADSETEPQGTVASEDAEVTARKRLEAIRELVRLYQETMATIAKSKSNAVPERDTSTQEIFEEFPKGEFPEFRIP